MREKIILFFFDQLKDFILPQNKLLPIIKFKPKTNVIDHRLHVGRMSK